MYCRSKNDSETTARLIHLCTCTITLEMCCSIITIIASTRVNYSAYSENRGLNSHDLKINQFQESLLLLRPDHGASPPQRQEYKCGILAAEQAHISELV